MTGTVLAQLALPVLVYASTGSALLSALAFATSFLPYLAAGVLLSALVDRVPTRRLLVGCNVVSALVALGMAAPGAPIAVLLLLACLLGLTGPVFQGGRAATLRAALPGAAFVPGRSLIRLVAQGSQIGGFALSGLLLTVVPPRTLMVCNAVSFAIAAVILRVGTRERPPKASRAGQGAGGSVARDSLSGIRQVFAIPPIRRLLIFMWAFPAIAIAPEALAVPYAHGLPGGSALQAGLMLTAIPAGTFAGETLVTWRASPDQQVRLIRASVVVLFLPLVAFAARPGIVVAIALLAVAGLGFAALPGLDRAVLAEAPEDLLARTLSIQSAGLMFFAGVGYAVAGAAAEFLRPAYVIALAGGAGIALVLTLAPRASATSQDSDSAAASAPAETTAS